MSASEDAIGRSGRIELPIPPYPMPSVPLCSDVVLRYEITRGRVLVTIDGLSRVYRASESLIVPAGVTHTIEAAETDPSRVLRSVVGEPSTTRDGGRSAR